MDQITFNLENYQKKGATSERAYWIDLTAKMLNRPFKQVLGITREWKQEWVRDMYLNCKSVDNPARLWWGLRRKNK